MSKSTSTTSSSSAIPATPVCQINPSKSTASMSPDSIEELALDEIWTHIDTCASSQSINAETIKSVGDLIYRTLLALDSQLESTRQTMTKFVQWAATCNVLSPQWQIAKSCASGLIVNSEFVKRAGCDQMTCLLSLDSLGLPEHAVAFQAMSWCNVTGDKGAKVAKSVSDVEKVLAAVRWDRIFASHIGHVLDASIKFGIPLDKTYPLALREMCLASKVLGLDDFKSQARVSRARHDQNRNVIPAWFPHARFNVENLKVETGRGFLCKDDGAKQFKVEMNTRGAVFVLVGPNPQTFTITSPPEALYLISSLEVDVFIVEGNKNEATFDFKTREIVIETTWRGNYSIGCFGCEPRW